MSPCFHVGTASTPRTIIWSEGRGIRVTSEKEARRGPVSVGSKLLRPFSEDTSMFLLLLLSVLTTVLVHGTCGRGTRRGPYFLILFSKAKAEGLKAGII